MFVQLSLDLLEPDAPAYSFDARVHKLFQNAPEGEKPYLKLALDLVAHTCADLVAGLDLVRQAAKTGARLSYRRDGLVLNYLLNAMDWFNESDEGGINFPETASQLQYSTRVLRRELARVLDIETSDDRRHMLRLPSEFFEVIALMERPARRSSTPWYVKPRPLKGDKPRFAAQPALWNVWAVVVKKGARK